MWGDSRFRDGAAVGFRRDSVGVRPATIAAVQRVDGRKFGVGKGNLPRRGRGAQLHPGGGAAGRVCTAWITCSEQAAEAVVRPRLKRVLPDFPEFMVEIFIDANFTGIAA